MRGLTNNLDHRTLTETKRISCSITNLNLLQPLVITNDSMEKNTHQIFPHLERTQSLNIKSFPFSSPTRKEKNMVRATLHSVTKPVIAFGIPGCPNNSSITSGNEL